MKRIWINFSLCLLLCLALILPATASEPHPDRLIDDGNLLTDSEEAVIEAELDRISEKWEMDLVIVTVETLDGYDEQSYADDFYDYGGYGYGRSFDGALLLLCPFEDARYLSTCGEAIDIIELDAIRDGVLSHYEDGDYYAACMGFADTCEDLLESAKGFPVWTIFIALIAGAVLSFLIPMAVLKGQLKTVAPKAAAADYVRRGSLDLQMERDVFLYRNVTRVAKPKNNSSGTHTSSSGRSHGGGRL